jgi:signal transduction histidine kinase
VIASNNNGVWNTTGASVQFTIAPAYYQTRWFLALAIAALVAVVWSAHRLRLRVVEKHQQEISALNERLMKAQEQERMRIAGELHDGVMQQMLAMSMMLGTAKRKIADDSAARPTLEKISDKLVEVGADIRRLSHDLHPPILQEAGLPQAVRAYCEQFSASVGIPVSCDADDAARDLSRGAGLALYRIMQEALGNAAKHARAKRIDVRLARANGHVTLTVKDDGVGFDRGRLTTSGLGVITMRERAGQLDGTFEFETAPGRGTVVRVSIPFR